MDRRFWYLPGMWTAAVFVFFTLSALGLAQPARQRDDPLERRFRRLVLLLLLLIVGPPSLRAGDGPLPGPAAKLRVVDLAGTPYRMGQVHGQTLKAEIRELVRRWKQDLEKTYQVPAEVFVREFLKKTDFKPAMERWTPGLLDEVRGIADGAGIDFDTMYAYQLIDEVWAMGADLGLSKSTTVAAGKRHGNPAYIAQTLDIPAF